MKLTLASSLSVLAAATRALGGTLPLGEYTKLWGLCAAGGPDVYVGVEYQGTNNYKTFSYKECYPYAINGQNAVQAVFCRPATCYDNPRPDCTGGTVPPVPVPVPAGTTLVNVAEWVELLGQGATCERNGLPNPLP